MEKFLKPVSRSVGLLLLAGAVSTASAIPLLGGLGGTSGFGELSQGRNDDSSSNQLNLPFTINFFGQDFNSFFVNNNGNMTFGGSESTFTPDPFPRSSGLPMIAPFWGDVDTRCASCGEVYVGEGQTVNPNDTVVATWNNVGFYDSDPSLTNSFQAIIRDRSDTGAGNFDIDFRYERLEWTTGDASGGAGGLGGTPAQAGYDAGNNTDFFTLPGSRTAAVLDLQNTSNVSADTPGLWTFAVRNGNPPGADPSNPLMPVVGEDGFDFDFNVQIDEVVFVDPPVAVGYEYTVNSGPNFASVLVPAALAGGDDSFELLLAGFGSFVLDAGVTFDLLAIDAAGFSSFIIQGIDVSENLDPANATAFVTGLGFISAGAVQVSQNPITVNVPSGVPVPGTISLLVFGLVGLRRYRRSAGNESGVRLMAA